MEQQIILKAFIQEMFNNNPSERTNWKIILEKYTTKEVVDILTLYKDQIQSYFNLFWSNESNCELLNWILTNLELDIPQDISVKNLEFLKYQIPFINPKSLQRLLSENYASSFKYDIRVPKFISETLNLEYTEILKLGTIIFYPRHTKIDEIFYFCVQDIEKIKYLEKISDPFNEKYEGRFESINYENLNYDCYRYLEKRIPNFSNYSKKPNPNHILINKIRHSIAKKILEIWFNPECIGGIKAKFELATGLFE